MTSNRRPLSRIEVALIAGIILATLGLGFAGWRVYAGQGAASAQPTTAPPFSEAPHSPRPTHTSRHTQPPPTAKPGSTSKVPNIPASAFQPYTWGYAGCSNTHDTIWGYHASNTAHLFWQFGGYHIEGQTVEDWSNPQSRVWQEFDREMQTHNGGKAPPVIWFELCVQLETSQPNYAATNYDQVAQAIQNLHQHAPDSLIFVSPLQSYDPPTLCPYMGPGGGEIPQMQTWLAKAVSDGLAYAGPGVDGNKNLGPLTISDVVADHCHPSGGPHGPGPGAQMLGGQLSDFFDHLGRS